MNEVMREGSLTLEEAIVFAAKAHKGQKYGEGPYILHPLRVMEAVSPWAKIPAVLHDVVEDTGKRPQGIDRIHSLALDLVTRDKKEPYMDYIDRIALEEGPDGAIAREIKLADLLQNLMHMTAAKAHNVRKYKEALFRIRTAPRPEEGEPLECDICGRSHNNPEEDVCGFCMEACKCVWPHADLVHGATGMFNLKCPVHGMPPYRLPRYKETMN